MRFLSAPSSGLSRSVSVGRSAAIHCVSPLFFSAPLHFTTTCQFAEGALCITFLVADECVWSPVLAPGVLPYQLAAGCSAVGCSCVSQRCSQFSGSASLMFVELRLPQLPGETVVWLCWRPYWSQSMLMRHSTFIKVAHQLFMLVAYILPLLYLFTITFLSTSLKINSKWFCSMCLPEVGGTLCLLFWLSQPWVWWVLCLSGSSCECHDTFFSPRWYW